MRFNLIIHYNTIVFITLFTALYTSYELLSIFFFIA